MSNPEIANVEEHAHNHDDIAALAHELWKQRGAPEGTPEEDWFQAEALLTGQQ